MNIPDLNLLSVRERQTLDRLLAGDQEKEIAKHLGLSPNTVHIYVKGVYRKFGVVSRGELLARFIAPLTPEPTFEDAMEHALAIGKARLASMEDELEAIKLRMIPVEQEIAALSEKLATLRSFVGGGTVSHAKSGTP
jgi:DNA-binding CsgD family transcriptional regulator